MNRFKLAGICLLTSTLALSGCVTRTYNLTRDRVDQDLTPASGNRGYIMGVPPEPSERKSTRTTRIFEVELGFANKSSAKYPSTTTLATSTEEPVMAQGTQSNSADQNFEKYTVGKNDTLQKISKKFYGTTKRWMKIYEANKDVLHTPNKLYPGQILNIPSSPELKVEPQNMAEPKENLK